MMQWRLYFHLEDMPAQFNLTNMIDLTGCCVSELHGHLYPHCNLLLEAVL